MLGLLLVLLAGRLFCGGVEAQFFPGPVPISGTATVSSPSQLFAALRNAKISIIVLQGNITISQAPANELGALPIVPTRNFTMRGQVPFNVTSGPDVPKPGAARLDFGGVWPVLLINPGLGIVIQDLVIRGMPPYNSPDVVQSGYPQAPNINVFPSIIFTNGSQVTNVQCLIINCSPWILPQSFSDLKTLLGDNVALLRDNAVAIYGNQSLPQPLSSGTGEFLGTVQRYIVGPVVYICPRSAQQAALGGTGSDGSLSAGAWAGIAIGIAAGIALVTALVALLVRRRRRRPAQQHTPPKQQLIARHSLDSKSPSGQESAEGLPPAALELIRRQQRDASLSSLLHVRFGGLEGLEIGRLIGRGAFGRVYRGSLRGATVAVKVIEHGAAGTGGSARDPAAEAVLLTALSHPNIVTVYRTTTLRLQPTGALPSGSSEHLVPPTPHPGSPAALEATPFNRRAASDGAGQMGTMSEGAPAAAAAAHAGRASDGIVAATASGTQPGYGQGRHTAPAEGILGPPVVPERHASGASIPPAGSGTDPASESSNSSGQYETWLVLEYCDRGSLEDALRKRLLTRADGTKRLELLLGILVDVAEGLSYLHEAGVVHGDLKPGNVLLKSAGPGRLTAKLADFGLSKLLPADQHSLVRTQTLGTAQYMPPELLAAGRVSRATDIYSMGVLMMELWTGGPAFEDKAAAAIFFVVVHQAERPAVPADMRETLPLYADLMTRCWRQASQDRPAIAEVLAQLRSMQAALPGDRSKGGADLPDGE